MKRFTLCVFLLSLIVHSAQANYATPGTGVKYGLADLVANSAGDVTFSDAYTVNDTITISLNDSCSSAPTPR